MSADRTLPDRVKMAEALPHAPTRCAACGGRNRVRRFGGGNHGRTRYKESGEVECVSCGNRERWSFDTDEEEG